MRPLQRGVIIVPSALTLANLFFGVWAIVSAARGEFERAAWLIVIAGIADTLDGRVARVTRTGSKFGEELDSLVDAISFGIAPALIVYHLFLADGTWGWIAAFFYTSAIVIRLARFNVEQAGHAKVVFHGLPSPSAGMTLATFQPFSQTVFFQQYVAHWAWPELITALMVMLGLLMMSHVPYPVVPKFGFRSARGILTGLFLLTMIVLASVIPSIFFFPALLGYVSYGVGKAAVLGFFERLPERDPLLDEEQGDEAGAELRDIDYGELSPNRPLASLRPKRRRRRKRKKAAGTPDTGTERPLSIDRNADRPRKVEGSS
ncbi:MAG: CDP-diacylglycerol--serine O-phosphatidyltransferase [Longimicrobiales bacterium]